MADVHYHIERPGPRSRYIIAHLLGAMPGWHAQEVPDLAAFMEIPGPKLIYGQRPVQGAFHILPEGLLSRTGLGQEDPATARWHQVPALFPVDGGDMPFDIFSASFFLLGRMEEYGPVQRDMHGRPVSGALHSARNGYQERPVVDEWLHGLARAWRQKDPRLPDLRRTCSQVATLDADNGAMYLGRPWWRSAGSAIRDLLKGHASRLRDRAAVLRGKMPDPYAVHGEFLALARENRAGAIINFLAAPRGKFDHAIPVRSSCMRQVIQLAARHGAVGLHPGYSSSDSPHRMAEEKKLVEAASGQPVTRSRQHYLRMALPGTMNALERAGIREEHSMGFADAVGFRAGTCTPYPFYDLHAEAHTALVVHPFAVMDSAMAYKMRLSPEEAATKAKQLVDAVRAVQGTFISVWHERFLSDYGDEQGWGRLAREVITYARP